MQRHVYVGNFEKDVCKQRSCITSPVKKLEIVTIFSGMNVFDNSQIQETIKSILNKLNLIFEKTLFLQTYIYFFK